MVHLDGWYLQPLESIKSGCLASFQGYGTTVQCRSHCVSLSCQEVKLKIGLKELMNNLISLKKKDDAGNVALRC